MIRDGYIKPTEWGLSLFTRDGELICSIGRNRDVSELTSYASELGMKLPVTPDNSPDRFTDYEAAIFRQGKCGHQTGYGLPWTEYCMEDSNPAADFGECTEHATEEW